MQLERYTADVICHSMGIGPLVDPSWKSPVQAIRLLLKPAFDPELCITIVRDNEIARLTVVALAEMLWHQDYPCRLPAHHETTEIEHETFSTLASAHQISVANRPRSVCLDGMAMNCAWANANGVDQFESHVLGDAIRPFVSQMIDCAWHATTHVGVRNGLARCARYVGREYPTDPEPPKPQLLRLGVFGTPDDIDDYLRLVNRKSDGA